MSNETQSRPEWIVQIPMEIDANRWQNLCTCLTPESIADVVGSLARTKGGGPDYVRVARVMSLGQTSSV